MTDLTACQLPNSAFYFNHSTQAHYCRVCAKAINASNAADAQRLYGHELCTPVELRNFTLEVNGDKWKVRFATSHEAALGEIAHARVTGSIGGSTTVNGQPRSDVVRLNEDGSEAKPYGGK